MIKPAWLMFVLALCGPTAFAEIKTVPKVDLGRYLGDWYEIARNPVFFEPGQCACAKQTLGAGTEGKVSVYNSCNEGDAKGPLKDVKGTATANDASGSKLTVDFGFPRKGDYWIIALDDNYQWAVVTDRYAYSLYVLSRAPRMEPAAYDEALRRAKEQVKVDRLQTTSHDGCSYPTPSL